MAVLYHITTRPEWDAALEAGSYRAPSLEHEGFIHCSTSAQYVAVANARFGGRDDLVLLFLDEDRLDQPVRREDGFPHVYGPINLDAVFEVDAFEPGPDGAFEHHHEALGLDAFGGADLGRIARRAREALDGFGAPWWIAGGWAIDLHHGRVSRPHADLEIAVLRRNHAELFSRLRGWDMRVVWPDGPFEPWDGSPLPPERHQIWSRPAREPVTSWRSFLGDPLMIDFMLEDHEGDDWVYRRDASIRRPLRSFGAERDGVPFVRPEVALLYKAKGARHKDRRDFDAMLPALDQDARSWLRDAVARAHPGSPWVGQL